LARLDVTGINDSDTEVTRSLVHWNTPDTRPVVSLQIEKE
jgi:hypothetical protein